MTDSLRTVVLGASGFLGAATVKALVAAGHHVTAVSRRNTEIRDREADQITWVQCDIRNLERMSECFDGADIVFHAAASTHPSLYANQPRLEFESSLLPLADIMSLAKEVRVKKIVFPSSGGTVYADQSEPRREDSPTDPQTPYAICKLACEQLLMTAAQRGDFQVDVLRISNLYGPGQPRRPGQGVIPHWMHALITQEPLVVYDNAEEVERDFIYVDDAAKGMVSCCNRLHQSDLLNLASGRTTSLSYLLNALVGISGCHPNVNRRPARGVDIKSVSLDTSRLDSLTGNHEKIQLMTGLRTTWNAFRPTAVSSF